MNRDMTAKEFAAACKRYGFRPVGVMGYYELPLEGRHVSVSSWNAGPRRRDQLAYLLQALAREEAAATTGATP